jgi:ectoine hydroxylase-related dioxygenase (phytanoyl-CoA dioxygenase family)
METLEHLKTFGYAIRENAVSKSWCDEVGARLDIVEADKRRKGTLLDRKCQVVLHYLHAEDPKLFIPLTNFEPVFSIAEQVLGNGQQIILNSLSASRAVLVSDQDFKETDDAWRAHIDTRMPAPDFPHTVSVCAMVCIDDFSIENGALKIWPLSHKSGLRPAPEISTADLPGMKQCVAPKGSIIYWLGQTWHAIGRNMSGNRRWGLISQYTYWWIKPTFDYTFCGPEIYRQLSPQQRQLFGFSSRPPSSPDIRMYTVTNPNELPDDYNAALGTDFARGQSSFGGHKGADG